MWYFEINFEELRSVSPFMAKDGIYMDEVNFHSAGLDPEGRKKIFVHQLADNFYLTEEEVNTVVSHFECFDRPEDVNVMTPIEIKEVLSGDRYSLYYRAEIHGY